MTHFVSPSKTYWINTIVPFCSVEVPKDVFNVFLDRLASQYIVKKHTESYDENGEFHYIDCYDALNCYGESLGTVCLTHEVNA